jgi:hypothetical protein
VVFHSTPQHSCPNCECSVNMLDCYWTVLDLIAPNYPLKILPGWIIELGVQRSCNLCILDLPLHEACLILGDSINKRKLAISWIKVMQSTLVPPKFHVWLSFRIVMHHKHLIVAVISDSVLLNHIAQRENVGNGFLVLSHMHMISQHDCLCFHFHGSTITFHSHAVARFDKSIPPGLGHRSDP